VKLSDLAAQNDDLRMGVETQLQEAGAVELAAYVTGEEPARAFVATDSGMYVGHVLTDGDEAGTVEGSLMPWSEVAGTRLTLAGFRDELSQARVKMERPPFDERASSGRARRALIEFATVCTRYQGRWTVSDG
jgi:hypothetical protein